MLRKNSRIVVIFTVVVLLALGNPLSYANSYFSDISSNHWAKSYINKMNDLGIITGYNGQFNPNQEVPVSQAIVMVVRLIDPPTDEMDTAMEIYRDLIAEIGVEAWAEEQVAYGLLKGVITEEDLRDSYDNGKVRTAQKLEICRYLTRALGLEEVAKSKELIVLSFNDNTSIPDEDKPYVSMMIDIGVIDQYGDVLGNFNPEGSMTRAIMAKVLSIAYDYTEEKRQEEFEKYNKEVVGSIEDIQYGDNPKITLKDDTGTIHEHDLSKMVEVTKGSNKISVLDLKVGERASLKVEDNLITKVIILDTTYQPTEEDVEGVITSILITNKVEINLKDTDGVERAYRLAPHNVTIIDQKTMGVLDLRSGYSVKLKVLNNEVIVIFAESKEVSTMDRYTGVVQYIDGDLNAFIIKSEGKTPMRVDTSANTTYINTIADNSSFNAIKTNTKVTVIGKLQDGKFIADTVVITE